MSDPVPSATRGLGARELLELQGARINKYTGLPYGGNASKDRLARATLLGAGNWYREIRLPNHTHLYECGTIAFENSTTTVVDL
jgi:hypothetical protein